MIDNTNILKLRINKHTNSIPLSKKLKISIIRYVKRYFYTLLYIYIFAKFAS